MFYDGEVPPKRVEISQVDLYERVGKSVNLGTLIKTYLKVHIVSLVMFGVFP